MKITAEDIEKVEKRFAAMSNGSLAALKRDELAPWAQTIYKREVARRGPISNVPSRPAQFRPVPPVQSKTNPLAIRKKLREQYTTAVTTVTVERLNDVVWPDLCPCCMEPADASQVIKSQVTVGGFIKRGTDYKRVREVSCTIPYCSRCIQHISYWDSRNPKGMAVIIVFLMSILFSFLPTMIKEAAANHVGHVYDWAIVLVLIIPSVAGFYSLKNRRRARMALRPTCSGCACAVKHNAARGGPSLTGVSFEFANEEYAKLFAALQDAEGN